VFACLPALGNCHVSHWSVCLFPKPLESPICCIVAQDVINVCIYFIGAKQLPRLGLMCFVKHCIHCGLPLACNTTCILSCLRTRQHGAHFTPPQHAANLASFANSGGFLQSCTCYHAGIIYIDLFQPVGLWICLFLLVVV